jgi:hypothetical protein
MYIYENSSRGRALDGWHSFSEYELGQPQTNQISFIEAEVTSTQTRDGRASISFRRLGGMDQKKRELFIKRFCDPILKYGVGRKLIEAVRKGNHPVEIAWGNGKFGFNGTIETNRAEAIGGRGSAAVIFIDQNAPDLRNLPTIVANPDVGLFHELLHAWHSQNGTVVADEEEMERRVIGIGKYISAKGTENDYRETRNLDRRCCWKKEKL